MGELPCVDEHAITIAAPRARVWSALQRYIPAHPGRQPIARLFGASHALASKSWTARRPHSLGLAGRHRFARYMLTFALTDAAKAGRAPARPDLRAVSWHPWQAYRTLVIGTRAHTDATIHILRSVRRLSLAPA